MSAAAAPAVVGYDVLRDSRHRSARAAREVADWLAFLDVEGKSPRTLDIFERSVAALLRMFPDKAADEFTPGDLLHALKQWPPGSRRLRKTAFNSFFRYLRLMGLIAYDANPVEKLPNVKPTPRKRVPTFTDDEVDALCALPDPDGPLMEILFYTGIRKGEAIRLLARHVELERQQLVVYDGKGGKDREILLFDRTVKRLAGWFLLDGIEKTDHLWYSKPGGGRSLSRSSEIAGATFHDWWNRCITAAGTQYLRPHCTRHTYARRWKLQGGGSEELRDQLGHESIAVTLDVYGRIDHTDIRAAIARMEATVAE